jgi:hypothetical protein
MEKLRAIDVLFEEFWKAYPRKVGKPKAKEMWCRYHAHIFRDYARQIMEGLELWKKSGEWNDPRFIPYPATFLNQRRWEDKPIIEGDRHCTQPIAVGSGPNIGAVRVNPAVLERERKRREALEIGKK